MEGSEGKREGYALLGRREGGFLEVLAFEVEDGRALCLFESQERADAFQKVSPDLRDGGWSVHVMTTETLPRLVEQFDYVSVEPSPLANAPRELISAPGFARSLRRGGGPDLTAPQA